ncbi:heavy metal-associated isoprenylated plant protein 3-like [Heracleum sosnowskyi]|uniref:Heavy metal-associated isoprenylated plant protein 3-like n=1 Tax=Heracleum sosnowskyi TaxID=360622 RepID=A0AAD8IZV7_9APIA|nr:heavy metal-associated isoprenylated plant protein 3-like [Heracleum sosnowskyi]
MGKNKSRNQCENNNNKGDDESNTKSEEKKNQGEAKKQGNLSLLAVLVKIHLHCDGCADKLIKTIRSLQGVESVKRVDTDLNKLTVIGNVDPSKLRDEIEKRTKKKVEIISPKKDKDNKNEGDGNDKKNSQPKNEKKSKDPPVTTAVLKVPLHCDGCIQKIQKLVYKTKGYMEMSIDRQKEVVTVKGAMDMKEVAALLTKKLKRNVEIVPAKKEKGDNKEKKEKEKKEKSEGEEKEEEEGGGKSGGKMEGNKKEQTGTEYGYGYHQYWQEPGYMPTGYLHAPQLFSDENPNACVVM